MPRWCFKTKSTRNDENRNAWRATSFLVYTHAHPPTYMEHAYRLPYNSNCMISQTLIHFGRFLSTARYIPFCCYSCIPMLKHTTKSEYHLFGLNKTTKQIQKKSEKKHLTWLRKCEHMLHTNQNIFIFLHVKINYYNTLPSTRTILLVQYTCIFIFIIYMYNTDTV